VSREVLAIRHRTVAHDVSMPARQLAALAHWTFTPMVVGEGGDLGTELGRRSTAEVALAVLPLELDDQVVSAVLRRSRISVLWMPEHAPIPRHVVAALDGSGWSRYVLEAAAHLADILQGSLGVVTTVPTRDHPRVARVSDILRQSGITPAGRDVVVRDSPPAEALPAGPGMVLAIGAHRGGTESAQVGDQTARRVIGRREGPILTVPL
jgi:hypothetical protein